MSFLILNHVVQYALLPSELQPTPLTEAADVSFSARELGFKVELTEQTLLETKGNVAKAPRILNLSASYLHRMIRQGIVKRS